MSSTIPAVTLNNGLRMPMLGYGRRLPDPRRRHRASRIRCSGQRLPSLDTAASYQNEEAVGRAIRGSGIPRGELFVTAKLFIQSNGEKTTRQAFETSLRRLGLDYVDLYLIHQPFGDYYGGRRLMEELHSQGLVGAIGVANFYPGRLGDLILHDRIVAAVNQIETHPFFQRQADQDFMTEHGVQIESWRPFAEGRNNEGPMTGLNRRSLPSQMVARLSIAACSSLPLSRENGPRPASRPGDQPAAGRNARIETVGQTRAQSGGHGGA